MKTPSTFINTSVSTSINTLALTVLFAVTLTACGSDSSDNNSNTTTLPTSYEGIWVADAYGEAIKITGSQFTEYQFTSEYCLISDQEDDFSEQDATDASFVINHDAQPTTLRARLTKHGVDFRSELYTQQATLPPSCQSPVADSDIELEFRWFSQLFAEYYPTFYERNVDWQQIIHMASAELTPNSDLNALLYAMDMSIQPLADSHVAIMVEDAVIQYSRENSTPEQRLVEEFTHTHGPITSEEKYHALLQYLEQQMGLIDDIRLSYAADEDTIKTNTNDEIAWYITDNNIGVLIIDSMEGLSNEDDDVLADINYLAQWMPQIISDLRDTDGLIIDVRNNTGGFDAVSQLIARHFMDNERDVYRKQARLGSTRTEAETYRLSPVDTSYIKPTVLLVSGKTVSAAEVFTLIMRELPHVTLMGETTQGALSDILDKELPSGIQIHLVNEYYTTMDGELFEVSGIPVDQPIPFATLEQRTALQDAGIEAAVNALLTQTTPIE